MNNPDPQGAMRCFTRRSAPLRAEPNLRSSQAKRAAAIASICADILDRQAERIARGEAGK